VSDSMSAFPLLLTTDLARIPGLRVVSETRMREVAAYLEQSGANAGMHDVARHAGASEIFEGFLSGRPDGTLRLDLNRVDAGTGATRGAFTVEARNAFDLADLATERIASD